MVEEKNEEIKRYKKISVVGFIVISLIGTLLHFTFNLSGKNILVGIFSAVNESVWEHLKIAVMPIFIWVIIELVILKYRPDNFWTSVFSKAIFVMFSITAFHYAYVYLFYSHSLVYSLVIYYVSLAIAQYIGYKIILGKKVKVGIEEKCKYAVIVIFMAFFVFTFFPLRLDIFKDKATNTYGILK